MGSTRKRLLNILIPPEEQVQIVYEAFRNKLEYLHPKNEDFNRRVFFDPHGGMSYMRYLYTQGEVTADRVRKCIAYHRSLREQFTMRLP